MNNSQGLCSSAGLCESKRGERQRCQAREKLPQAVREWKTRMPSRRDRPRQSRFQLDSRLVAERPLSFALVGTLLLLSRCFDCLAGRRRTARRKSLRSRLGNRRSRVAVVYRIWSDICRWFAGHFSTYPSTIP